ncbi:translation initiation factor IF-3 [Candidatus Dojkabacteria bacterium]|uniref:Translation initiation factor IF-3 n=1 Tax=Candidatus Dojkabacteria bacterium TaxID=2099670 RepID=A0A955HYQ7_9BACT|nr:translation initiation factor IF-3 [Candidatus Dojkabacteria bacterium]MCB9790724.1 translation initiation factor IF-3 [Candidatus Nomurabacteria bacterium]
MYKKNYQRNFRKEDTNSLRKNYDIRSQEVSLIDSNGENLGTVPIQVAMSKAKEAEMDLVEVNPKSTPPVCKIMDYSKYLYEQRKKMRKGRKLSKVKEMKEFRFTPLITENDAAFKIRRAIEYLEKGHNVKLTMRRRGRQPEEQARATFTGILTKFEQYSSIEPELKRQGRDIFITFKGNGSSKDKKKSQNSIKTSKDDKSEREQKAKDQVQAKRSAPSEDKKVNKSKKKKVSKKKP